MTRRELAEKIENVERTALADFHAAAPPSARDALGLRLERIDGALVSIAARDPGVVINRALGLGMEAPATEEGVRQIVDVYSRHGVGRYYVHLNPEARPPELRRWLLDAGLAQVRGWMQFRRGTAPPPAGGSDLRADEIGSEHAEWFGRIAAEGFGLGEAAAPALAGLVKQPNWHVHMTFDGDEPAGAAALCVADGVAWFDWAATRRQFRRRGSQGLLLERRIRQAVATGCELLVTETGEAVEGDPQHSYRNILKAGFEEAHLRENFGPAG